MRISTSQIFNSGASGIGRNQGDLFKLQNQMSTGRRVLTPQDDPIAAEQVLVLSQSSAVTDQLLKNQTDAQGKLNIVDTQVGSVVDLLQNVRDSLVQASSGTLTNIQRTNIATSLEASFSQLMGIANSQDSEGNYLFSGYQGAVKPFSATTSGAVYQGDDGLRLEQVGASRQIATNVTGKQLFEAVRNGNGSFVTSAATTGAGAPVNTGTGIIDQGSVTDPAKWSAALAAYPGGVQIKFSVAGGVTSYQLFDNPAGTTQYTGLQPYTPGQSIKLETNAGAVPAIPASDFGATLVIKGQPANGDTFTIVPSTNESIFTTLRSAITTLTTGISGANTAAEFSNRLAESLGGIDRALENVVSVRSNVGSNLSELDSLAASGQALKLQYTAAISGLQDLDYTKAITDSAQKQAQLQAAQLSFKQISQLSLFSIL